MNSVGLITSEQFLLHETGNHPECPGRLRAILNRLENSPLKDKVDWITPKPLDASLLEPAHTQEYRHYIEESSLAGKTSVDFGETMICPDSYEVALLAAGAAVQAVDLVLKNEYKRIFVASRPPGHHARPEQAMGFCLFNNVAIAAHYARKHHNIDRTCIIDWDVHHGNGTQEIFYQSPHVLFCSIHQLPLYPHTGEYYEKGIGRGDGLTINSPVLSGATLKDYKIAWEEDILPAINQFNPELILLSAGFDAHAKDPLAQVALSTQDYTHLTNWVLDACRKHTNGKLVSLLEGGYNFEALAESVEIHLQSLLDHD